MGKEDITLVTPANCKGHSYNHYNKDSELQVHGFLNSYFQSTSHSRFSTTSTRQSHSNLPLIQSGNIRKKGEKKEKFVNNKKKEYCSLKLATLFLINLLSLIQSRQKTQYRNIFQYTPGQISLLYGEKKSILKMRSKRTCCWQPHR